MALRSFRTELQIFQCRIRGYVTSSKVPTKVATLGIDFGCKNSRVTTIDSLVPQVVDSEAGRFVPSYVALTPQDSYVSYKWGLQHLDRVGKLVAVGELAKRKMWVRPSDVICNIKKMIGKQFDESSIQEMMRRVHFNITEGPGGEPCVDIHGLQFSPVEITSAILAKLKDTVLLYQFHHESKVVICVPAFFSKQQKEHIMSAAHSAGLKILQLIDESVAAALSSATVENGTVVVFGMGSGSYSIAILHVSPDTNIEIITQISDPALGGDRFDDVLVDYFVEQIIHLHSVDIHGDKYAMMMMLAEAAEQAKVVLSSKSEVTLSIPDFPISAQGPVDLNITISRIKFEELVDNLIGQIKVKCQSILKDAKMSIKDIDEVILTGGMARVPRIQRIISEVFGHCQSTRTAPEEAMVIGSALQAALLVEDEQELSEYMIPLSIGIDSGEGTFTRVIPRHTPVPTKQTVKIPGWLAYGECKHVRIYFGEHAMVEQNLCLGEVKVANGRRCQGCVNFELTLEVDEDYVVKVTARNADDQNESADDDWMACEAFQIKEEDRCKERVKRAVKRALLDWSMYNNRIDASLRNLARHVMNSLRDIVSARKDELPENLCQDAVDALIDLQNSFSRDACLLKDKMLYALKVESKLLSWIPTSESVGSHGADYQNGDK